jgi:DNA-binding NarL/FixJ family response regulator
VEESSRIRVLIVDDHAVVRMGLRVFFDLQDDIEVVGEAGDGSEGVAMARRLEPDVVLMDLLMPNMDGVTAIGRIKAERPETEIVTMTSFIEEEKVTAALEAGASGYVLKDAEAEEVATAVRAAFAGEVHLDPAVARLLAQRMRAKKSGEGEPVEPLTDREKDVIRLLGQGMSNKEIGSALFITERTARTYVSNILGKLGLASRTQAALWAVEHKRPAAAPTMTGPRPSDNRGGVVLGLVLIVVGGLFLLDRAAGFDLAGAGWPLFVIVPGVLLFVWGLSMTGREGAGLAVGGAITTVVGVILAVQNATGLWATWAYAWALVGPGGTGVGLIGYGLTHRDQPMVANGLRSLGTGLALFVGFGLFFEGVIGLSGAPFLSTDIGPVVLIGVGVAVLLLGVLRGRGRPD